MPPLAQFAPPHPTLLALGGAVHLFLLWRIAGRGNVALGGVLGALSGALILTLLFSMAPGDRKIFAIPLFAISGALAGGGSGILAGILGYKMKQKAARESSRG